MPLAQGETHSLGVREAAGRCDKLEELRALLPPHANQEIQQIGDTSVSCNRPSGPTPAF